MINDEADLLSEEPCGDQPTIGLLTGMAAAGPTRTVPLGILSPGDSPRLAGERIDHVRALAEAQAELPPILVHGPTMRVIDGMHRLRAAQLRGAKTIDCRFFDGTDDLTFAASVAANVAHGLPLSLTDREAAAARILLEHPSWSSRSVAAITGLAPSTVNSIRFADDGDRPVSAVRLGMDGRLRPLSTAEGRRIASEIIARRPEASLREIAKAAGISTGTVRDVRLRLARGEDPVPERRSPADDRHQSPATRRVRRSAQARAAVPAQDRASLLRKLRNDPSLRLTQAGRQLLRWLDQRTAGPEEWEVIVAGLPPHSAYVVAELAYWCSERWLELGDVLRERSAASDAEQQRTSEVRRLKALARQRTVRLGTVRLDTVRLAEPAGCTAGVGQVPGPDDRRPSAVVKLPQVAQPYGRGHSGGMSQARDRRARS